MELSPADRLILQMTADAVPVEQIADAVHLAVGTVKSRRWKILQALGAEHMVQAVAMAMRRGLIK